MDSCPKKYEPPPAWLPVASDAVLAITIPTSIYIFYLIVVVTPPHTDKGYKMYLLAYHVITTVFSILNMLLGIVQYMPSFIIAEVGYLGSKSYFLFGVDVALQGIVGSLGVVVFLHRFSVILYGEHKRKVFHTMFFVISLTNMAVPGFFVYYFTVSYDSNQAQKHLLRDCPHFFPILSHQFLYLYHPRTMDAFLFILVFFPVFNIVAFTPIFLYCIIVYIEKSKFFSKTTKNSQVRLIINMALTILIPTFSHGILSIIASVLIRFNIELELWIPTLSWFLGSTHGIMNCVALVMLNDYYRKKLTYDIRFLLCLTVKKLIPASKVSVGISVIK